MRKALNFLIGVVVGFTATTAAGYIGLWAAWVIVKLAIGVHFSLPLPPNPFG